MAVGTAAWEYTDYLLRKPTSVIMPGDGLSELIAAGVDLNDFIYNISPTDNPIAAMARDNRLALNRPEYFEWHMERLS